MGFMTGVVSGVALAAGAAAWYLSRSGSRFRDQYRVEDRLAEFGDEMERRTRDLQATVEAQVAEMRSKQAAGGGLDPEAAASAEAEAAEASIVDAEADADTTVTRTKKKTDA
jgi:hypothetical protein